MKIRGLKDTIKWYNQNATEYSDIADKFSFTESIDNFLTFMPEKPRVLDAGCGSGRDTAVFQKRGVKVIGIDISIGLLEEARKKFPEIKFLEGNFSRLPLPDSVFNGVWSHASLVHLEELTDVEQALAEFHRVLKPGGWLYVYVKKQVGADDTAVVSDTLSNHERFFRYYTPEVLGELLKEAGFIVDDYVVEDDVHGREEVKWIVYIVQKPE